MSGLRKPSELKLKGNLKENWRKFTQNLNLYLLASGNNDADDGKKIAILLNLAGEDAVELYNKFALTEGANYETIIKTFEMYCDPEKYYELLQRLFCNNLNSPMFQEIKKDEAVHGRHKEVKQNNTSNKKEKNYKCFRCLTEHGVGACSTFREECKKSKKEESHFARACRDERKLIHEVEENSEDDSEEGETEFFVANVTQNSKYYTITDHQLTDLLNEMPKAKPEEKMPGYMQQLMTIVTDTKKLVLDVVDKLEKIGVHCNQNTVPSRTSADRIKKMLPVSTIDELIHLNEELASANGEELKRQLESFITSIGGVNSRDHIIRVLRVVFTNHLAEQCSWKGQKNNYKIEGLNIVDVIYSTISKIHFFTQKEFQMITMDWLRHARQRRERDQ